MKSFLLSPWTMRLLGFMVLSLLIWFAGPLLAFADYRPLEAGWVRIALIVLLFVAWLVRHAVRQIRARMGNRDLLDSLVRRGDVEQRADSGNSAQIRERFERAAAILKNTRFDEGGGKRSRLGFFSGRRYAYQLPWYLFMGAPGSGKTTALMHSGLRFPLSDELGNDPLHGVGGTRNCEWWFTDQAVLIDTAGRYTTQDSHAQRDAKEWKEFIDLIKRFRPRQPINGVLATISAGDLLGGRGASGELQRQAAALRARLTELQRHLGYAFPVYLLVTKTDLLPGFAQFFEDLDREQREQVWGNTFPLARDAGRDHDGAQLRTQLDALEARLFSHLLPRLHASRDGPARALIYGFPNQWVQLKEAVSDFANQAFSQSRVAGPILLRGVYFTSGTQEGTPIDRVLGSLARSLGIENKLMPAQKPSGKSFFLTRLLRDVVFAEAGLAGTNRHAEKRLARLKWSGIAAAVVVTFAAITALTASYIGNEAYINAVAAKTKAFKKALATHASNVTNAARSPAATDLSATLPLLEQARLLAHTRKVDPASPPALLRAGLFQGEKLQAGADQAYSRMLGAYLAPQVSHRIETRLRREDNTPELQYETLKSYLMLHRQGRLDVDNLKTWVAFDLAQDKERPLTPEAQQQVQFHLDALLERDAVAPTVAADPALVAGVRRAQLQAPFAQRVYNRIKRHAPHATFKEFRVTDAGGPNSQLVFTRTSGQPLSAGVPGLFTYNGYYKGFNPQLDSMLTQLAEEEVWVLGVSGSDNARRAANPMTRTALADEVRRLYLQEYAAIWERYIADLSLVRTASLAQSIEQARILSAPDSPLPPLLRAMAKEVTLSERPSLDKQIEKQIEKHGGQVKRMLDQGKDKLGALLGSEQPVEAQTDGGRRVEAVVDERFENLRRFVRSSGANQPAPVDTSLGLINELYLLLTSTDAALKAGNAMPQSDVPNKVRAEAARMPEPMRGMLASLADSSQRQAISSSRGNLGAKLAGMIAEPCQRAVAGRYPFVQGSRNDMVPEDFARLFAREGLMDDFFQKNLAPLVDTSTRPWRFRNIGDPNAGGVSDALVQFERAQEIRKVFFSAGGNGLSLRLSLKPVEMDRSLLQSILDVDGQVITYAHDSMAPVSVQWPGPRASNQVTLQTVPLLGNGETQTFDGPWALFRLFDKAEITRSQQPEHFRATFRVGGRRIAFDVATSSAQNPFRMPELQAFECPRKL
jgi:type VI secretion system protein ImpL